MPWSGPGLRTEWPGPARHCSVLEGAAETACGLESLTRVGRCPEGAQQGPPSLSALPLLSSSLRPTRARTLCTCRKGLKQRRGSQFPFPYSCFRRNSPKGSGCSDGRARSAPRRAFPTAPPANVAFGDRRTEHPPRSP